MKHMLLIFHTAVGTSVSHATVARTPSARARGLRGRAGLMRNESMLFTWPHVTMDPFTMEGVTFPLDFVFVGPDSRVVDVRRDVQPGVPKVTSRRPFMYAIELPAGFAANNSIVMGTRVSWMQ